MKQLLGGVVTSNRAICSQYSIFCLCGAVGVVSCFHGLAGPEISAACSFSCLALALLLSESRLSELWFVPSTLIARRIAGYWWSQIHCVRNTEVLQRFWCENSFLIKYVSEERLWVMSLRHHLPQENKSTLFSKLFSLASSGFSSIFFNILLCWVFLILPLYFLYWLLTSISFFFVHFCWLS